MFFFFIFLNWTSHFTVLETLPSSVYPFAKHTVVQVFWWYRIRAWRELRHDIELCRPVISKGDQINLFHKKSPSSIFLWYSCLNISRKISDSRFIHLTKGNGLPLLMRKFPTNTRAPFPNTESSIRSSDFVWSPFDVPLPIMIGGFELDDNIRDNIENFWWRCCCRG